MEGEQEMKYLAFILSIALMLSGCSEGPADVNSGVVQEQSSESDVPDKSVVDSEDYSVKEEPTTEVVPEPEPETVPMQSSSFVKATVTRVVDGDTMDVRYEDGSNQRIRFIGVNTPETKHPTKGVEFYGQEASEYTKNSLSNKEVYLQKDVSDTDQYGRGLRYIWLEVPSDESNEQEIRSKMFNAILVLNGYANVMTYPPDVKYADYFKAFQAEAKASNTGLWSNQNPEASSSSSDKFADKSETDKEYAFMGNSSSQKLHKTSCTYAVKTSESNRVYFKTREEAVSGGYVPCKSCNP